NCPGLSNRAVLPLDPGARPCLTGTACSQRLSSGGDRPPASAEPNARSYRWSVTPPCQYALPCLYGRDSLYRILASITASMSMCIEYSVSSARMMQSTSSVADPSGLGTQ